VSSVVLAESTAICITVLRRKARSSSTQLKELLRIVRSETNLAPVTADTFCHRVRRLSPEQTSNWSKSGTSHSYVAPTANLPEPPESELRMTTAFI